MTDPIIIGDATLYHGEALEVLRTLPDQSAHCCVTSPPYWGLRDYGTGEWEGGDPECDHVVGELRRGLGLADSVHSTRGGAKKCRDVEDIQARAECPKCGATRIDAQLGLETTPEEYVARLVGIFREARRVLRDDGTLWLNLGDSYAGSWGACSYPGGSITGRRFGADNSGNIARPVNSRVGGNLKPKDLVGIPWRVAFALQQPYYTGRITDERDRIWLAAMIDGEGCIFIHKRKAGTDTGAKFTKADGTQVSYERKSDTYGSGLEFSNTNRTIVERCLSIAGQGSICTQEGGKFGRKQTLFRWNLRSNECRGLLAELYPYLIAKQHEARLAIGCPPSGKDAAKAHASLKNLHSGGSPCIDFPAPAPLFEPGFYLRSDVIWSKSNPMPESVTDRPTKAHEYLFLLSKSARYYYDAEAIRDPDANTDHPRHVLHQPEPSGGILPSHKGIRRTDGRNGAGRNKRTVWTVATKPYPEAHFATYPPKLIEPCILAGCPAGGTVLDPFCGSGTTGEVCGWHGRKFIGIDLSADYLHNLAAARIQPAMAQARLLL